MLHSAAVEQRANEFLEKTPQRGNGPVFLERLAQAHGYHCRACPADIAFAQTLGAIDLSARVIYINTGKTLTLQRYALARQLGIGVLAFKPKEELGEVLEVKQALAELEGQITQPAAWAACVLLPRKKLSNYMSWRLDEHWMGLCAGAPVRLVRIARYVYEQSSVEQSLAALD